METKEEGKCPWQEETGVSGLQVFLPCRDGAAGSLVLPVSTAARVMNTQREHLGPQLSPALLAPSSGS